MQEAIKVVIVEDEAIWQQALMLDLQVLGFEVVATANNSDEALTLLASHNFDIALLDITINGKNSGIELGKIVSAVYQKPFIFITGSTDSHTMEQAVIAKPSAYIIKPANRTSLLVAIQNAISNHQDNTTAQVVKSAEVNDFVFVKVGSRYKKIRWSKVVGISSDGNYTKLFSAEDGQSYFIRSTLPQTVKNYLPEICKEKFVQINRSELINIDFVQEISADEIVTAIKTFNCSEAQGKLLKKRLNILS